MEFHIGFAHASGLSSLARDVIGSKPLSARAACSILNKPHCDDNLLQPKNEILHWVLVIGFLSLHLWLALGMAEVSAARALCVLYFLVEYAFGRSPVPAQE
jgi:hypothetical protein